MITFEQLYPRFPIFLQNAACSAYGWKERRVRFNSNFERHLEALQQSEFWSGGDIESYQDEQVKQLIRFSYEHVPFYRQRMQVRKLKPADVTRVVDLQKLPILTKEDVRQNPDAMRAVGVQRGDLVEMHTSGTTGKSLHFMVEREAIALRWAIWWRHRLRFGVRPGARHVNFTGKRVVPPQQRRPPFWRWNLPGNQILLNMHHMVPEKIQSIADFLSDENVTFYSGYPSIIHAFAMAILEAGLELSARPEYVFTGAENMLDFQRRDIAAVTGATLSDQYGFAEGCGNASQCPEGIYHEDFEFGVLEQIDATPGESPGSERGKIIATGFASPSFPFIRYDVGDVGLRPDRGFSCTCGRQSSAFLAIEGRADDYVVTPEGRRIMRFDYLFKDTANVSEAQVVQRRHGEVILRIVRRKEYRSEDEQRIRSLVGEWISPNLEVRFEYVGEITRGSNGKFKAVLSEMDA